MQTHFHNPPRAPGDKPVHPITSRHADAVEAWVTIAPTARRLAAVLAAWTLTAAAPGTQLVATFTPPPGWSPQELFGKYAPGMSSIWNDVAHRSGDFVPKIFVMQESSDAPSLRDSVRASLHDFTGAGYRIRASKPQPVCGGKRAGWLIAYTKTGPDPLYVEQTRFLAEGTLYTATYARLNRQQESAAARTALGTLCVARRPMAPP